MCNGLIRALTDPVFGALILERLYAHEQVKAFNLCWELRLNFLGEVLEIKAGLNAWHQLQCDLAWEESLCRPVVWRLPLRARWSERDADSDGYTCSSASS